MGLFKDITDELRASDGGYDVSSEEHADPDRADDATDERSRDNEHLCRFCRSTFDADRNTCPECGAEIVLRGDR